MKLRYQIWPWITGGIIIIALFYFLALHLEAGRRDTSPVKPLGAYERSFVESWNDFVHYASAISPASPDYLIRCAEKWNREEVGQKFRKFENALLTRSKKE